MNITIPGFTAEASIFNTSKCHQTITDNFDIARYGNVIPQMRATMNHHGLFWRWYFEQLCNAHGGGMSTNPDGSLSCDW